MASYPPQNLRVELYFNFLEPVIGSSIAVKVMKGNSGGQLSEFECVTNEALTELDT
jgi:hypothetical protein